MFSFPIPPTDRLYLDLNKADSRVSIRQFPIVKYLVYDKYGWSFVYPNDEAFKLWLEKKTKTTELK